MPWIGKEDLKDLNESVRAMEVELATVKAQLDSEKSRRERVELEYSRLNDDFRGLIALTAGRVPPKIAPEFDKDLFAEDTRQPVVFLSPDPDEPGIDGEAILQAIEEARSEGTNLSG